MRMHTEPRCKNCKHQQGGRGNVFLCGLIRTKDDKPLEVITPTTTFKRYENCAYRFWDRMLSDNAPLSAEELIKLSQQTRVPELVRLRDSLAA